MYVFCNSPVVVMKTAPFRFPHLALLSGNCNSRHHLYLSARIARATQCRVFVSLVRRPLHVADVQHDRRRAVRGQIFASEGKRRARRRGDRTHTSKRQADGMQARYRHGEPLVQQPLIPSRIEAASLTMNIWRVESINRQHFTVCRFARFW